MHHLERGCFVHLETDDEADHHEHQTQQERDPPSVCQELRVVEEQLQCCEDAGTERESQREPDLGDASEQPPLATDAVSDMSEDDTADRTDQEPDRERGERQHGADERTLVGEERLVEDQRCGGCVEEEVVPLDRGPQTARRDDGAQALAPFEIGLGLCRVPEGRGAGVRQIGAAAEAVGFESVLTPTGAWCEDAWLTTAMMIDTTETLKFLVALRPGLISPTLAAQMAATFQWQSKGRLLLNVVTGGEDHEQRAYGDVLDKNQRYARCGEYLDVLRRLWAGDGPVDFSGEYVQVGNAQLQRLPDPVPPLFFGGSSPAAGTVASQFADTYLTWGEPPSAVAAKIAWIRDLAEVQGRTLDYGIRLHVISRDTSEEAWAEADRLLSALDPATVENAQRALARSGSEGQRRMLELHGGGGAYAQGRDARTLEVAPNLWSGVGLVRGGAGTALVGSHEEVADRIAEYSALGLDHFVLSGYPHLEEAYRFGEGVRPILERRGLVTPRNRSAADLSGSTAFLSAAR